MNARFFRALLALVLLSGLFACTQEAEQSDPGLLRYVPADAPYAFVTSKHMPEPLREKLAEHFAAQMASQANAFKRVRRQLQETPDAAGMVEQVGPLFDVVDAVLAEFEHRQTAAQVRELGIEPVTRSAVFGIGLLPAVRAEIADAGKFGQMLDRVEQRAGIAVMRAEHQGQPYRRIDLGPVDMVLAVTDEHAIAGLLADRLFDQDLPLLLGTRLPQTSLAQNGEIARLIERHGFTGYGEGYVRVKELVATLLGRGEGRSARTMAALGDRELPMSEACMGLVDHMASGMPQIVMGVSGADERHLAMRSVWESTPAVASRLQQLSAPVAGVGASYEGLLALGMGLDLPALRNGIEALLREVVAAGAGCDWVDPDIPGKVLPQLNLVLGPMTAGIKGFNLQLDELQIDPESGQPLSMRAGLLAAVDDPRGIFALGAMFNPALAALEIPSDGSLVDLPVPSEIAQQAPPMKVAIQDKALLLLAGSYPAGFAHPMLNAALVSPAPLFAADYGIAQLVERFGGAIERASSEMVLQGDAEMAQEMLDQLETFRLQAAVFDRIRVSVIPSDRGLILDQVMTFQ